MSVHVFGMIGDAPVMEIEIGSQAGARAKVLTWGAVVSDSSCPSRRRTARDARPQLDRGLRRSFAELRRGARTIRQSDRQRAIYARRRRAISWRANPARSTRCTAAPTASATRSWKLVDNDASSMRLSWNCPTATRGFPGT